MNYNILVIVSVVICAIISHAFSYYLALLLLGENHGLFKIMQFIVTIILLTTFYAPTKYILMKFINFKEEKREENE